jgi:hypothetical protein
MNIVRTAATELSTIPAIAYKQKLSSGGAGIKILRLDSDAFAVFTVDKRTGEAVPYKKYDAELFPDEAVFEALELTSGLPYALKGNIKITVSKETSGAKEDEEDVAETEAEKVDMVDSGEYRAIIERYSNEKSKLNYTLMNKDFIQFAGKSKIVGNMVADRAGAEDILSYIVKNRAAFLAGKKETISDGEAAALIETLDEIDTRSAFKELSLYIKRLLAKSK